MSNNRYGGVDSYAAFFIAFKVKQLIRSPFFTYDDYEDLEQELMLAYLLGWPMFDPHKGHKNSFIKALINNAAGMIIREAESQMRWTGFKETSLFSELSGESDSIALMDLIGNDDTLWCQSFLTQSHRSVECQMDIQKAISNMPSELRIIYDNIKEEGNVSKAAKALELPITTLCSKVKKLRHYLDKSGIKDWIEK